MEAEMLCKATEGLSNWFSPFLVVSITFNVIGLVALVYFLYQVMGLSFVMLRNRSHIVAVRVNLFLRGRLMLAMVRRRRRRLTLLKICQRRLLVLRTS